MNSYYFLCFVGIISLGASFPTIENEKPFIKKSVHRYNIENVVLDPKNLSTETILNWNSNLNISAVSSDNNPNDFLSLYYNASENFNLPESIGLQLAIERLLNIGINTKEKKNYYNEISDSISIDDNTIFLNASLGVAETILPNIDFSDFNIRSRIDYTVVFQTIINISFPYNVTVDQVHKKYPELHKVDMPLVSVNEDQVAGKVPLVNGTGIDKTDCVNTVCSSSTEKNRDISTFFLFDNISVTNSREVQGEVKYVGVTNTDTRGVSVYSRISDVTVNYIVVIGEHRC